MEIDEKKLVEALNIGANEKKKTPETASIKCDNCGSTAIIMKSNTLGICEYCGSKIKIKHEYTNNIKLNVSADKVEKISECVVLKTNHSSDEFLRGAIIQLVGTSFVPANILDGEFSEVETEYPQFMIATIHYEGTYSGSVGYDRREQYEDYQKEYDAYLKTYVNRRVLKERTVTDWHPYNGNLSINETVCVRTDGNDASGEQALEEILKSSSISAATVDYDESELQYIPIEKGDASLSDRAIKYGERLAVRDINFPGDHVRDVHSNFTHEILETRYCIAPEYCLKFKFDGKEHEIKSFAADLYYRGTVPNEDDKNQEYISGKTKKYAWMSISFSIFAMVAAILLSVLIGGFWSLLFLIFPIVGYIVYKKQKEKIEKVFYNSKIDEKIQKLEEYLQNHNLPKLTDEEIKNLSIKKK